MATSSEVPTRVRQLASELTDLKPMRRGSVSDRKIKCGKPGCACAENPNSRHGPYSSLTQAVKGKTQSRFLTTAQAAIARQQVAAGHKFREHVEAYWKACQEWGDAELELAAGPSSGKAEKKGSKRRSKTGSPRKSARS